MGKLKLTLFLAVAFSLSIFAQTNMEKPAGTGTQADPFQIASLANLSWLTQTDSVWTYGHYFIQTADIDASETATWDDADDNGDGDKYNDSSDVSTDGTNEGWLPLGADLGDVKHTFDASYDGQGHIISGITINRPKEGEIGFISEFTGDYLKNLGLTDIKILDGLQEVAGLAGTVVVLGPMLIENCYTTGTINSTGTGYRYAGLLGRVYQKTAASFAVTNCYSKVDVTTAGSYVGGLIADIKKVDGTVIKKCYATGNIDAAGKGAGGLIGYLRGSKDSHAILKESYATGNVVALDRTGGLIGLTYPETIVQDCYSTGDVSLKTGASEYTIGGFCGACRGAIEKSYSVGTVSAVDSVLTDKGFISWIYGTPGIVSACFFDKETSGQINTPDSMGTSRTTAEMQTESTFTDSGWNFTDTWEVNNTYPNLKNNSNPDLEEKKPTTKMEKPAGKGTQADPFQIASLANLSWLTQTDSVWTYGHYFIQTADIDASETATWDDADDNGDGDKYNDQNDVKVDGANEGWLPLGADLGDIKHTFDASYDGQGHTISGITINRPKESQVGFFSEFTGDYLKNLGVINLAIVDGLGKVGGMIGAINVLGPMVIEKCYTTGSINSTGEDYRYGGLVGVVFQTTASSLTVSECYSKVNITTAGSYVGGLMANFKKITNVKINKCYATGNVSGNKTVGGFIGKPYPSTKEGEGAVISECYSTGNVTGNDELGGFMGYGRANLTVENCYSLGSVTRNTGSGGKMIAGFVGHSKLDATFKHCYSVGAITFVDSTDPTGNGFIERAYYGGNWFPVLRPQACFFDKETSGQINTPDSMGTGRTTAEMKTESTFTDSGWNFTDIWEIVGNNYPNLRNNSNPVLSVRKMEDLTVTSYSLEQNYPNPFNPSTVIRFAIPTAGNTTLAIYNVLGQKVKTLVNQELAAGSYSYKFDASNLSSGIYFYKLQSDNYSEVKKMMLIK